MSAFVAHSFSEAEFRRQLAKHAHDGDAAGLLAEKRHPAYLHDYLASIGVRTLVVETEYVDRDYLEDYSAYYVRSFQPYHRFCTRIHFFGDDLTQTQLDGIIDGTATSAAVRRFRESYCGFLVVRPLPQRIIGRTCIRTYEEGHRAGGRRFPVLVPYEAHLAGLTLGVPSVAYQEQDAGVAACATSALWSAFQVTARRFGHAIMPPVAITRAATDRALPEGRVFPSPGLSLGEMCLACHAMSLEAEVVALQGQREELLAGVIYSYVSGGLPVIMLVELVDRSNTKRQIGMHAVTICGMSLVAQRCGVLRSARVDKVYAHYDQIGPFARMAIERAVVQSRIDQQTVERQVFTTSWGDSAGRSGTVDNVVAVPVFALVPVYHKIRVGAPAVIGEVMGLHKALGIIASVDPNRPDVPVEWDVALTDVCQLKREWRSDGTLDVTRKGELLRRLLPRFMWRAKAVRRGRCMFEVLFDATDTCQGVLPAALAVHDQQFTGALQDAVRRLMGRTRASLPPVVPWFANA